MALQLGHRPDRLVELHAVLMEIIRPQAHGQRQVIGPHSTHGIQRLAVKAQALFERSAISIRALIGQGREETRTQITVGEVHLQPLETGRKGSFCGGRIGPVQVMDLGDAEFLHGIGETPTIGNGRRAAHLPTVGVIRRNLQLAFPRLLLAALAASMAELNRRDRPHVLDHLGHAGQAIDLRILPKSGAGGAGAAVGRDGNLFGKDQAKSAGRT